MAQSGKLEVSCAGERWCPVTCASSVLDHKWHPVIVDRLLEHRELGFNALRDAVDGVSAKVLSESLDDLTGKGFVEREVVDDRPFRVAYRLTDRGESLAPVVEALREWGASHLRPPDDAS
jgi:DNA-binding HxlR family transcriptional regulator